jgi:L-ribulose-5-phosphate 4-epimerase
MNQQEIAEEYEKNTGEAIIRAFEGRDCRSVPAILVASHGPFTWGSNVAEAAHNAVILESVARMAYFTLLINGEAQPIERALHDRHYLRKHGASAYYGQARNTSASS